MSDVTASDWLKMVGYSAYSDAGRMVDALLAVLALHEKVRRPWTDDEDDEWQCTECMSLCHSETGLGCDFPFDAQWPCETVRRIHAALGFPN